MNKSVKKSLKIISEAYRDKKIPYQNFKKVLAESLKRAYGVEDLVFWKDPSNWFYCELKSTFIKRRYDDVVDNLDDLLYKLPCLDQNQGSVFLGSQRYESLEELKRYILTLKLSGINNEKI